MAKILSDADADSDGKLNLAEYRNFDAAMRSMKEADGEWNEADHAEENYNIVNYIGDRKGFIMLQMRSIMAPWLAMFEELKATDVMRLDRHFSDDHSEYSHSVTYST